MKKIVTTSLLASLLAVSLYAQNDYTGFYPVENNDTPDYLLENKVESLNAVSDSSTSVIDANTLLAFYPAENSDTPDYLKDNKTQDLNTVRVSSTSTIDSNAFLAFYPAEHNDTPDYILNYTKDEVLCGMNPSEHKATHHNMKSC
ncbi:hypothetical protein KO488_12695 [Poseidonibacter lekithochrous]|uniref:hypothetical protein n=1 Tax=Poseidonibacter TaxID=2321187 RepID=UPI001C08D375|nr:MULTISPECIES: hypothetical protein [Poseidonibacter]MBU3015620.1 hypothetical protein [Poseidonibacter lekithochrous]MDO6828920.1 hypothetical protein [Poseidonibacter sp. 1_MG-2023]